MCESDRSSPVSGCSTSVSTWQDSATLGDASRPPSAERSGSSDSAPPATPISERSEGTLFSESMCSPAASPARGLPRRVSGPGSTIPRLFCGGRCGAPLASCDPDTSCWRTWPTSLLSETEPSGERYSGTWPRSGSMSNGIVCPLPPSAPRTSATGCSLLLPTPEATNGGQTRGYGEYRGRSLYREDGQKVQVSLQERVTRLLPTPRARTDKEHGPDGKHWAELRATVEGMMRLLPTPHGMAKEGQERRPGPTGNELGRALTGRSTSPPSDAGSKSSAPRLNPSFVEWMIGAPDGWSDPACPLSATEFLCRPPTSSDGD